MSGVLGDSMTNMQEPETRRIVCPPGGGRRRAGRGGGRGGRGGGGRGGRRGGGSTADQLVTVTLRDGSVLAQEAGDIEGNSKQQLEVCRNYLSGRCTSSNCPRLHDPAGIPQTAKSGKGNTNPKDDKGKQGTGKSGKNGSKEGSKNATQPEKATALRPRLIKGGNTKSFKPSYSPPDMRVVIGSRGEKFGRTYGTHDVVMVPELFCDMDDSSVYDNLLKEIKAAGKDSLWASWHGDSHLIADDKRMGGKWKDMSPTFLAVVDKIRTYFDMDIQATRFNWYRDSSDWKPYHHDAAAMKAHMATKQNITIAASFGAERDVSFMHAKTKVTTDMPQPNGCAYAFGRDLNLDWQHGILQLPPEKQTKEGARISIIAWGWVDQMNDDGVLLKKGMY